MLEIPPEHLVLGPRPRIGPIRPQPSHQPSDPVRRLDGLVAVTLQMEGGFDEMAPPLALPIHALGRFDQKRRALLVLVENKGEPLRWLAVLRAVAVNPLDRLQEHPRVEPVRIVRARRRSFPHADIEHEAWHRRSRHRPLPFRHRAS